MRPLEPLELNPEPRSDGASQFELEALAHSGPSSSLLRNVLRFCQVKPRGPHAPNPLPIETVRDLLGIVRALYAVQRQKGNHGHARELHRAGGQLRQALTLATHPGEGAAQIEAWRLADEAIAIIARVQGANGDDLSIAVQFASSRVQCRHFQSNDRDARRRARVKRG